MRSRFHDAWLSNPKADLLSGLVVALALIPEAISFSIIAGVDPKVGALRIVLDRHHHLDGRRACRYDLGCDWRHGTGHCPAR